MCLSFPFNHFIILTQFTLFPLLLRIRDETNALETKKKTKLQKVKEGRDERLRQSITKKKDAMDAVIGVITCEKISNLSTLIADATRCLDRIERGSLSSSTKHNSLLGRWRNKEK